MQKGLKLMYRDLMQNFTEKDKNRHRDIVSQGTGFHNNEENEIGIKKLPRIFGGAVKNFAWVSRSGSS